MTASIPPLFQFAWVSNPDEQLQRLADMAQAEDWNYRHTSSTRPLPVLYSYLHHTFMRIQEEGKICERPDAACFNTGLVTDNQEEIFAYFVPNRIEGKQKWYLAGFCRESDRRLLAFGHLPEMAHYFEDPSDLLYHTRLELRRNLDHIVDDNRERFPQTLRSLPDNYQLRIALEGAIKHTLKRVQRNYKTAIPQYYRTPGGRGQLQLLLPLCMTNRATADLALAVYKQDDVYLAATCLTLDMAYNNARLIARPDSDWLTP